MGTGKTTVGRRKGASKLQPVLLSSKEWLRQRWLLVNMLAFWMLLGCVFMLAAHAFLYLWLQRIWLIAERVVGLLAGLVSIAAFVIEYWHHESHASASESAPKALKTSSQGARAGLAKLLFTFNLVLLLFLTSSVIHVLRANLPTQIRIPLSDAPAIILLQVEAPEGGRAKSVAGQTLLIPESFYLGVYEVTEAQWQSVMGTPPDLPLGEDFPVRNVSWEEAQSFLQRLSKQLHRTDIQLRLPNWMEWEYACEAGTITRFFGGNNLALTAQYAWEAKNSNDQPWPVGQKAQNPWGFYDILGNVAEWCNDAWQGATPPNDHSPQRAICGGSYKETLSAGAGWLHDLPLERKQENVGLRILAIKHQGGEHR